MGASAAVTGPDAGEPPAPAVMFKPGLFWAWSALVAVLVATGVAVGLARPGAARGVGLFWALAAIFLFYLWRMGVHPRLVLAEEGITVVQPFAVVRFGWDEVSDVVATYNGLTIVRRDGPPVTARMIFGRPNYASLLHRESRSDRIASWVVDIARSTPQQRRCKLRSTEF